MSRPPSLMPSPPRVARRPERRVRLFWPMRLLVSVTLLVPVLATASITTWLKGALHLGIYGERVATLQATLPEDHGTWGLAFSPHGRYLAASSPQTAHVQLWDWREGRVVRRFRWSGPNIMVTTPLAISPHGRLLATCQETGIDIWNRRTGAIAGRMRFLASRDHPF